MAGSQLGVVYGTNKLVQDLTLWLSERYGIDAMHPAYGSDLENYIGGIIGTGTQAMVYNEVMRVLDNYQKIQIGAFKSMPQKFSLTELLWSINSVNISIAYDAVSAAVNISNGVKQSTSLTVTQGA